MATSYPKRDISNQLRVRCCEHVVHLNFILLVKNIYHYMIVYDITHTYTHIYIHKCTHNTYVFIAGPSLQLPNQHTHLILPQTLYTFLFASQEYWRIILTWTGINTGMKDTFFFVVLPCQNHCRPKLLESERKGCGLLYGIFRGVFDEAHMPHILTETALSLCFFFFCFTSSPLSQ